ncbi:conserved hypothetical protein [Theileria equi strain WA]|uniref:Srp40 C-terminal domain-containing protein n=1 Tax=Theileria equi strain WA TaxID=1537102 RepID=L1LDI6_THEEQ|nr:conserved hypothetical protein [Theileria equi strain WA]EKX73228.1 conserved hypothetical protein [Theileria equi strain WA]|eukprot:XP_004832680.1 conserved hypothetical protein [Theileria equi strain WA]
MASEKAKPTPLLYLAVKILSNHGLKKTIKRLGKEYKCKKLKAKHLPKEIRDIDIDSIVPIVFGIEKNTEKVKESNAVSNTSVIAGFVKSPNGLPGTIETPTPVETQEKPHTPTGSSGTPFRRIDNELWFDRIEKEELKVNSYKAKHDPFVLKAAEELSKVKGKDFRHEKSKKKKASWKGSGEITNVVNSISFDDSDDGD